MHQFEWRTPRKKAFFAFASSATICCPEPRREPPKRKGKSYKKYRIISSYSQQTISIIVIQNKKRYRWLCIQSFHFKKDFTHKILILSVFFFQQNLIYWVIPFQKKNPPTPIHPSESENISHAEQGEFYTSVFHFQTMLFALS